MKQRIKIPSMEIGTLLTILFMENISKQHIFIIGVGMIINNLPLCLAGFYLHIGSWSLQQHGEFPEVG